MNKIYFCSQYRDINDKHWKSRACSISCLWMGLKSLREDFSLSPDELLEQGLYINAFVDPGFWKHDKLAVLAHNYGVPAYAEEFKSAPFGVETVYAEEILNYGVEKIFNFLKNKKGVIIVSIPKDWKHFDKPHSVLLHDIIEENGEKYFIYNDSEKENEEEGENRRVDIKEFKMKWRRLAIFLNKIKN